MQLFQHYNTPRDFNIFLFGDDHEGLLNRHQHGWEEMTDMLHSKYDGLRAKYNFAIDHGDVIESRTIDHPFYDTKQTKKDSTPLEQVKQAIKHRLPIAKKLITVLDGNHPRSLRRVGDLTKEVCDGIHVPYGTWSCKVHWIGKRGDLMFKSFHTHGSRSITSIADDPKRRYTNLKLILKRHLKFKHGDCLLLCKGHTHKIIICEPESELYLIDDGGLIKQKYTRHVAIHPTGHIHPDHRWYVNTGSFLKMYGDLGTTSYVEVGDYDPIELAFAIARVRDGNIVSIDKHVME